MLVWHGRVEPVKLARTCVLPM
ncbi:hypothetical protein F383_34863 [Gossypium arboreum]|uniref:Uncharacterized protein n=1 Tax=Gossypium arboreum TaxID=29729 RepID=A0A0B0N8Q1_GOSAR|nr:hypothetical protein F383_34863 [Gossypium arboreum]